MPVKCACDFLQRLEVERHDLSYRSPATQPVVSSVPVQRQPAKPRAVKKASEARDKLYFNAGRYSAGARDAKAVEAWKQLEELGEA
jgi:hypothetical protein